MIAEEIKAPLRARRVLVVEDNKLIGTLYIELLEEMGHSVCAIVATETEAVAAASIHKPDLMIVDASLAEGSGVSAVKRILRAGFVPHVFISGNATSVRQDRSDAIVMQKPFWGPDLECAIQRALAAASKA